MQLVELRIAGDLDAAPDRRPDVPQRHLELVDRRFTASFHLWHHLASIPLPLQSYPNSLDRTSSGSTSRSSRSSSAVGGGVTGRSGGRSSGKPVAARSAPGGPGG